MATFDGNYAGDLEATYNSLGDTRTSAGSITIPPGAEPANATPPTITGISPTPGTEFPSRSTPLTLTVEDDAPGLRLVILTIQYVTIPGTYVIHDGSDFAYPFDSGVSTRVATVTGWDFTILPRGGWPADIAQLWVYAVDQAGNLEGSLP